jgi:hypothetical protein
MNRTKEYIKEFAWGILQILKQSESVLWDIEAPIFSLDNRLTDGGEVVSLKRRPPFNPRKIPGTNFC